jgi:small-conductance mechanosensitive channel
MDTDRLTTVFQDLDGGALLELALILAGAVALIAATQLLLPWLANRLHGKRRHLLLALVPLLRLVIVIGAFLLGVPRVIEPSLQNMVAVLGSLGLALGFALKDYASSLVAGVVAVGEAPYRNGDWVEIDGHYGEVVQVGMRVVKLVTADDNLIAIPHAKLWDTPIVNANNGSPQLQCAADFYLAPAHDGAAVRALLHDIALTSPYLHLDRPVAVVAEEQPWATRYRLKAYPIDARQQFRFVTDLSLRAKAELQRRGIAAAAQGLERPSAEHRGETP